MPRLLPLLSAVALLIPAAGGAQPMAPLGAGDTHHHHHGPAGGSMAPQHASHEQALGPAGATYDLRFLDAMVQHHIGALQMSEFVFDIGAPAVGALAKQIWRQQAQEIKAMGQWRKAWYPEAPVYPVALPPGADPNDLAALKPMTAEQITAMRMLPGRLTAADRVAAYLTAMIQHHGAALAMAHDALANSANPSIRRLAHSILVQQQQEMQQLRRLLPERGLQAWIQGR